MVRMYQNLNGGIMQTTIHPRIDAILDRLCDWIVTVWGWIECLKGKE